MSIILGIWLGLVIVALGAVAAAWVFLGRRRPTSPTFYRRRRSQVINFPDRRKMRRAP